MESSNIVCRAVRCSRGQDCWHRGGYGRLRVGRVTPRWPYRAILVTWLRDLDHRLHILAWERRYVRDAVGFVTLALIDPMFVRVDTSGSLIVSLENYFVW